MKGKKFYLLLIGLIAVGIGSVFFYRQQQEARALEFEGYEISNIENRVDDLYNDKKTDIKEDISNELINLEIVFEELNEKNLGNHNKKQIEKIESEFMTAKQMFELQKEIYNIFDKEDVLLSNTSLDKVNELESFLITYETKSEYYNRNSDFLNEAKTQIQTNEEAESLVDKLESKDLTELTIEEIEKVEKLINQMKNKKLQETLNNRIEAIGLAKNDIEDKNEAAEEEVEIVVDSDIEETEATSFEEEKNETAQNSNQRVKQSNLSSSKTNNNRVNNTQSINSAEKNTSSKNSDELPNETNQKTSTNKANTITEQYQETKREELKYSTTRLESSSLVRGTEQILKPGTAGYKDVTYEVTVYSNGTSNRKIINENIVDPVNEVITVGTREPEPIEEPSEEEESE